MIGYTAHRACHRVTLPLPSRGPLSWGCPSDHLHGIAAANHARAACLLRRLPCRFAQQPRSATQHSVRVRGQHSRLHAAAPLLLPTALGGDPARRLLRCFTLSVAGENAVFWPDYPVSRRLHGIAWAAWIVGRVAARVGRVAVLSRLFRLRVPESACVYVGVVPSGVVFLLLFEGDAVEYARVILVFIG